jgi:GNAT superfamily N-acetyltransferase
MPRCVYFYGMIQFTIRRGQPADTAAVMSLVQELAHYERAPHEVTNTSERMLHDGFGPQPLFDLWVVESPHGIIGMALCYVRYSTWKGPMYYLEDFYVQEAHRGAKIGAQLFEIVLEEARQRGMAGICWQVLEWNEPALNFYRKYNAVLDPEWINGKIMF